MSAEATRASDNLEASDGVRVRAALERMRGALSDVASTSATDQERACGLVAEAAVGLTRSAEALEALLSRQQAATDRALGLLKGLAGMTQLDEEGLLAFLDRARAIVGNLTTLVSEFSKENIRVTYVVDDLVEELDGVFEKVARVDGIADDTALLAINAALEAARAGEAGRGFGVVSSEVRKLSQDTKALNEHITQNVDQARELIREVQTAVERMASRDFCLHEMVAFDEDLSRFLEELCEVYGEVARMMKEIDGFHHEVEARVSDVIRELQFEDIATQVIRAAMRRIDAFVAAFGEAIEGLDEGTSPVEAVERVATALEVEAGAGAVHMPAEQTSLDEGDAFLF